MAKELPYFKFDTSAWIAGKIQMCSRESKGLFVDLSALYWSRLGDLNFKHAVQVLCNGNANAFDELLEENLLHVDDKSKIILKFLDSQLKEFKKVSKARSQSARARWDNANALQTDSKCNAIRGEEIREEEIRENKDIYKANVDKNSIGKKHLEKILTAAGPEIASEETIRKYVNDSDHTTMIACKNSGYPKDQLPDLIETFVVKMMHTNELANDEQKIRSRWRMYVMNAGKNHTDTKQKNYGRKTEPKGDKLDEWYT